MAASNLRLGRSSGQQSVLPFSLPREDPGRRRSRSKRIERIDARGAPRRDVRGNERDTREQEDDRRKNLRIVRADAKYEVVHHARQSERGANATCHPGSGQAQSLTEHEAANLPWHCAERHPDPDLLSALLHWSAT
jgi:hypothetical protein